MLGLGDVRALFFFLTFLTSARGNYELVTETLDFVVKGVEAQTGLGLNFKDLFAHVAISDLVFEAFMFRDHFETFHDARNPCQVAFSEFEQVIICEIFPIDTECHHPLDRAKVYRCKGYFQ